VTPDASTDVAPIHARVLHSFPDSDVEAAWRAFLPTADYATHYVAPEFFREPFFVHKRPFAILVFKAGRVVAVLSGIHEGKHVICGVAGRPQLAVTPPFARDVQAALIRALLGETKGAGLVTITTWSDVPGFAELGFAERRVDAIMTLDLTRGPDALHKEFAKGRKSDITFAKKAGVVVREFESEDELRAYYEIYVDWCARKQIPANSFEVMRAAFALKDSRRLFLAFHEGKTIAGSVVRYTPSGVAEYSANNSLPSALNLRPNSLLNWVAIQWAHAQGLKVYSMGGSHPFLRHFGGTEIPIYRYRKDLTFLKRHDTAEWATGKLLVVARAVKQRLEQKKRSAQTPASPAP
jgi:hypothetical protein